MQVCNSQKLLDQFVECNKLLDSVQKGLADYLETKRLAFARLATLLLTLQLKCVFCYTGESTCHVFKYIIPVTTIILEQVVHGKFDRCANH